MAELVQRKEIPHDANLKCPVCEENVPVLAIVDIASGSTRNVGSNGFRQPVISVSLNTKVVGFKIHHECDYTPKED